MGKRKILTVMILVVMACLFGAGLWIKKHFLREAVKL